MRSFATCPDILRNASGLSGPGWRARNAPVAQLDRAPDYESGGQEFESLRARQIATIQNIIANCWCARRTMFWRGLEPMASAKLSSPGPGYSAMSGHETVVERLRIACLEPRE
jgi:hypothetical protein